MIIFICYLVICLLIFLGLAAKEYNEYSKTKQGFDEQFWVAVLCLACPVANIMFLVLLIVEYCRYI
jgi:hypothetical protein